MECKSDFKCRFHVNVTICVQMEEMYKNAHAAIRKNPESTPAAKRDVQPKR